MAKRSYGQFCGLTRAMELVGERWTLLIIRDLLVSPKRYTDLHRGLPGIPTNILSARLKELERNGIVRRRVLPRPAGSIVYELTEYGSELEGIVLAFGRWGARSLGEPAPGEIVTADSLVIALRATFQPAAARRLRAGYELRWGEAVIHARIENGSLTAGLGPLAQPDLVIDTGPALHALLAGELSPDDAVAGGGVRLTGRSELFERFVEVFRIAPAPSHVTT